VRQRTRRVQSEQELFRGNPVYLKETPIQDKLGQRVVDWLLCFIIVGNIFYLFETI